MNRPSPVAARPIPLRERPAPHPSPLLRAGPKRFAAVLGAAKAPSPAKAPAARAMPEARATRDAKDARKAEPVADEPKARPKPSEHELLDPATRQAAQLAPPLATPLAPAPAEAVAPRARVSMEELLPQLVRRIAWAGDRRKGTVQLELGAGRHAGTTVTVHADEGRVRVELAGAGADELRGRIDARLRERGIQVESVT